MILIYYLILFPDCRGKAEVVYEGDQIISMNIRGKGVVAILWNKSSVLSHILSLIMIESWVSIFRIVPLIFFFFQSVYLLVRAILTNLRMLWIS